MECNKIKDLLTPYVDGELGADKIRLVDSHVRDCSSCLSELLFLQRFKRAAAALPRKTAPDRFLEEFHKKLAASPPLVRFLKNLLFPDALKTPAGAAAFFVTAAIIAAVIFNAHDRDRPARIAGDKSAVTDSIYTTKNTPIREKREAVKTADSSASRVPASAPVVVYELVLHMQDSPVIGEQEADDAYRAASRRESERPAGTARDEMAKKAVQADSPVKGNASSLPDARKTVKQTVLTHGGIVISDSADFMLVEIPSVNLTKFTGALRAADGIATVTVPDLPKKSSGSMVIRLRFAASR